MALNRFLQERPWALKSAALKEQELRSFKDHRDVHPLPLIL
jgi:hypothetical protein